MAFKIYVENNHIVVQDLISDKEFRAASKDALIFKDKISENIYNTEGFFPEGLQGINFSDIVDENEIPFTDEQTFKNFFSENTGNFNQGGSSPLPTDEEPTEGSTNAVSSNGVFDALANKVDKEVGKSLISNTEITRLANLSNNSNVTALEGFGDSITVGQGATNTNFAYINLVAQFIGKTLTNRALSGSGVWAAARSHIQNINPNHSVMAFVMSGFNDTRRGGSNPLTRLKIMNSYRSILANHFLRNFITAGATDSRILRANGTWQTTYTGLALGLKTNTGAFSSTNGATIEFTFSGNNVVLGMVAVKQSFETHATFTIHIDNVLIGTYNNNDQTDGISDGVYDNNRTQMAIIFDNLSESMHTIRLTNISTNPMIVDYFGQLKQPKQSLPICIAKMPKMNSAGYATAPNLANDALIDSLNADIVSVCNEFRSKGYPVYVSETNDYYDVNTGLSADSIHPNNGGYTQIYNSIVAEIGNLIV